MQILSTVETGGSASATLLVTGEVDASEAQELRSQLTELLDEGHSDIVADLSGVSAIESAGLAALVRIMKTAREAGGDLRLIRPQSEDAFRVFRLTKFDEIFVFEPSAV